jgi:hypothetical protein
MSDSVRWEGGERRWLWGWIAAILIAVMAPYVVAAVAAPPGKVCLGSLLNADDAAQFLSAMRQGEAGYWLYHNPFTPEDTMPALMYSLYMVWGKATGWTGIDPLMAYHLLRAIGVVLLLVVLAQLARRLLRRRAEERTWRLAFLLAAFSSGLGWLAPLLPREIGLRLMADLALIEISTFQSMLVVPHFAWGLMFEALAVLCFVRAVECRAVRHSFWRWSLSGGAACLGLGLVYPFALVVVYAVLGSFVLFALATRRRWGRASLWSALTIGALGAPIVAYYALVFRADPLWRSTHVVGNATGSPPVPVTMAAYGLDLALAIAGSVWIWRKGRWRSLALGLLVVWGVVQSVLPYLPVPFQGRFAAGWHLALSMLAALGVEWVSEWGPVRWRQRVRSWGVMVTVPSTLLVLMAGPYLAIAQGSYPFYLPAADVAAVEWLGERVDETDIVLASYAMGNTIPTRASCRVFVGHQFGSYRLQEKLAEVEAFYGAEMTDEERRALLADYGVNWVYYGSIERRLGDMPALGAVLELAYDRNGVSLYRVRLE